MNDVGHMVLWNVDCVYVEEEHYICAIPKDKSECRKLNSHFEERNFTINYINNRGFTCAAFIERVQCDIGNMVKLFPKYVISSSKMGTFDHFEMTGEALDDFFSPSGYFFKRSRAGENLDRNYLYQKEIAEEWNILFEEMPVSVTLSYGDILRRGIASDLILHPKLTIQFPATKDLEQIYRIYSSIIRFLKIIRYEINCGTFRVELRGKEDDSYNHGYLVDFAEKNSKCTSGPHDVDYCCFYPYVQRLMQFAADNPNYSFNHYPKEGLRFLGIHYTPTDYTNLFSAFESECHACKELYEKADASGMQKVKDALIDSIENYPIEGLSDDENQFLHEAKERITQIGTQYGQKRKIINAYNVLHKALDNSIQHIFYRPEFRMKGHLKEAEIQSIAGKLSGLRGKIAHGNFCGAFSDVDAQKIHFLEILVYAQTLKRAKIEDEHIERILRAVFGCNYILSEEWSNDI